MKGLMGLVLLMASLEGYADYTNLTEVQKLRISIEKTEAKIPRLEQMCKDNVPNYCEILESFKRRAQTFRNRLAALEGASTP